MSQTYTKPDFASIALITIDMQTDFLAGEACEISGTSDVLQPIAALTGVFRTLGLPIIHIVRLYERDGTNADPCRRAALEQGAAIVLAGSRGAELAPALRPSSYTQLDPQRLLSGALQELGPHEWAMYKPRWGAFYKTVLQEHLAALGITTLAFSGCNFPNCPRTSIYEASERDFRLVLVHDALSGIYERGSMELRNIGVEMMSTEEMIVALRPPQPT